MRPIVLSAYGYCIVAGVCAILNLLFMQTSFPSVLYIVQTLSLILFYCIFIIASPKGSGWRRAMIVLLLLKISSVFVQRMCDQYAAALDNLTKINLMGLYQLLLTLAYYVVLFYTAFRFTTYKDLFFVVSQIAAVANLFFFLYPILYPMSIRINSDNYQLFYTIRSIVFSTLGILTIYSIGLFFSKYVPKRY